MAPAPQEPPAELGESLFNKKADVFPASAFFVDCAARSRLVSFKADELGQLAQR